MVEGTAAILEASLPLAEVVRDRTERPKGSTGPPDVTARLEGRQGAVADLDGRPEVAGRHQDVSETALGERSDVVEATGVRDGQGLAAIRNCLLRVAADEALQESRPV